MSSPCARDSRSGRTKLNTLRHVGKPVWVALAAAILESGATAACRVVVEHGQTVGAGTGVRHQLAVGAPTVSRLRAHSFPLLEVDK
jgi:hypothetical protein